MDLRIALQSRGLPFQQSLNDHNEIRINCLWCVQRGTTQDFRQRLSINLAKGVAICFNCGFKSRKIIPILIKKFALGEVSNEQVEEKEQEQIKLPEDFETLTGTKKSLWAKKAKDYLTGRGVVESQIRRKKIGYSLLGRFAYRIVFPVYVPEKKTLDMIVARSFVSKEPRYLNSTGRKSVYNLPSESDRYDARVKKGIRQILVVSEGVLKCLAIERAISRSFQSQCTFYGDKCEIYSISLLGHTMTEHQEALITPDRWDEICLFPDPDAQGANGFIKIAERFSLRAGVGDTYMNLSVVWPFPKKQADEMDRNQIRFLFNNRTRFNDEVATRWLWESRKSEK